MEALLCWDMDVNFVRGIGFRRADGEGGGGIGISLCFFVRHFVVVGVHLLFLFSVFVFFFLLFLLFLLSVFSSFRFQTKEMSEGGCELLLRHLINIFLLTTSLRRGLYPRRVGNPNFLGKSFWGHYWASFVRMRRSEGEDGL